MELNELNTKTVPELRKLARTYGIAELPNGTKVNAGRKVDLIAAITAHETALAKEAGASEEVAEALATQLAATDFKVAQKVVKENKRRATATKCEVCKTAKIDRKTQGADSTMCRPCFDKAGLENEHADGNHADAPVDHCPDCEFDRHSDEILIDHPKAELLAKFAKANGWKVSYFARKGETVELLVSPISGDETVTIVWTGRVFQYELSSHRSHGKNRKVRNVSAAKRLISA